MSNISTEESIEVPDELNALKSRADMLGLSYHPSIGLDKLREKVNAALADPEEEVAVAVAPGVESPGALRARKQREATELVRIRVACMNPNKKEWEGEIFSVGNSLVGTHKKYVPFNAEEGWHVPRIIYNLLVERECQTFYTVTDKRGNKTRKGKLIKEFSVEVLPNLTAEELQELARRQGMARSID